MAIQSTLAETPPLQTLSITDKIQIPIYRGLTETDSWYYRLILGLGISGWHGLRILQAILVTLH